VHKPYSNNYPSNDTNYQTPTNAHDTPSFSVGARGAKDPSGGQLDTPLVRSTADQKRRENQLALKVANKEEKANKARLEEERKKKLEEEKEAAKAPAEAEKIAEAAKQAESGKELLDLMEMEDNKSASSKGPGKGDGEGDNISTAKEKQE
jgi:hypothetical protein